MAFDAWYKTTLPLKALGTDLKLQIPHDVFSTIRIDEGTLLLLDHLPQSTPRRVLDMGCGYGALGLPIAAHFSNAKVDMVDRDLLAVEWSGKNALANQLPNVRAFPSLGYRDVPDDENAYDWILCNVPARIGRPFIENIFEDGRRFLSAEGELRVVVISDLGPVVELIANERRWPIREVACGPRHIVFNFKTSDSNAGEAAKVDPSQLYRRDTVKIGGESGMSLERPFDISGDSVRITQALPALIDALPRKAPRGVFCFRCGYGALPLLARQRWPDARVVACDRDLLATTFARENARRLNLDGGLFEVRESVDLTRALRNEDRFDLACGELSPSAGRAVAEADLLSLVRHLRPGGEALILTLEKTEREWINPIAAQKKLSVSRLLARDGNVVLRLVP